MSDSILLDLGGAAALLIWGLRMASTGITRAFGARLGHWLAIGTRHRLRAFAIGLAVTCATQSSTATALMASMFCGRGLIAVPMGLATVIGANVGTALVAQALSADVHWLTPLALLAGVALFLKAPNSRAKATGRAVIGLGLLLLALQLLGQATVPLRGSPVLAEVLAALANAPLPAALLAALLTIATSSSLAVILFVATLAEQGIAPNGLVIAMVLGANLGSAAVPMLGTGAASGGARQVATGTFIMRVLLFCALLPFTAPIASFLGSLDPAQLATHAHLAFNGAIAMMFLPMLGPFARFLDRWQVPGKVADGGPRYVSSDALDNPAIALACAAREALHLGDRIEAMLLRGLQALRNDDPADAAAIPAIDDEADALLDAIKLFLARLKREQVLSKDEARRVAEIELFAINLEHVGDIIDGSLRGLIMRKIRQQLSFSDEGRAEIERLYATTLDGLRLALSIFATRDPVLARQLVALKVDIRHSERQSMERHLDRVRAGRPESVLTSALHLDMLRDLKRIGAHIASVAYPLLEAEGVLADSRLVGADHTSTR